MHLSSMSVGELTIALYPRMFALHNMPENAGTQGEDGYIILPPWERLLNQVCIIIERKKERKNINIIFL